MLAKRNIISTCHPLFFKVMANADKAKSAPLVAAEMHARRCAEMYALI
jgi:hypothetical protein